MKDFAKQKAVMKDFLQYLNEQQKNPYILKGGTALMFCYGLDRFSEDLDFDAPRLGSGQGQFFKTVRKYCNSRGYALREAKDTQTTKRAFITYDSPDNPLKIEVSYRRESIPESSFILKDGIKVYDLDTLALLKANAYIGRDKIRDLYDVSFICTELYSCLREETKNLIGATLAYKDIEQFDYLINTQSDPLIDITVLEDRFLRAFENLGLLVETAENDIIACMQEQKPKGVFPKNDIAMGKEDADIKRQRAKTTEELGARAQKKADDYNRNLRGSNGSRGRGTIR